ncbi:MAG: M24 family metallopeptidase, partial [Oscillospiraceae bacterium]
VVSGAKSARPHGSPSEKVIENGDFLTMDFGFLVNGYCSDMTRTICIGNASEKQKEVYNLVLKAQLAALDAIKPEIVSGQYDKIARKIIEENGYGKYFGHGLGHGVGIDIHEAPNCGFTGTDILKPGMIITCEPGIYLENQFGVRIEDMGAVTVDGFDNFTKSTKELICI